jgi:hypothetical protein
VAVGEGSSTAVEWRCGCAELTRTHGTARLDLRQARSAWPSALVAPSWWHSDGFWFGRACARGGAQRGEGDGVRGRGCGGEQTMRPVLEEEEETMVAELHSSGMVS